MSNNLQALVQEFAKSGKTPEQVCVILDKMGIPAEKIQFGISMYYPKKTIITMTIKEKLNLEERINTLKEAMKGYNVHSSKAYYIGQINDICDKYLKPMVAEASQSRIDEAIGKINELKGSLVEYNTAVEAGQQKMVPTEVDAIMNNLNEQQIALTTYTNTQRQIAANKLSHAVLAKSLVQELRAFDWMNPVGEFIRTVEGALTANAMGVAVEEAYTSLDGSNAKKYYQSGLDKLDELRLMTESDMRQAVTAEVSGMRWIPQLNAIYEHNIKLSKDIDDDANNLVLKRHSYVVEHEGGLLFALNGSPYYVKENTIIPFAQDKVNALFITLMACEETFRFKSGEMVTSKGENMVSLSLSETKEPIFKFNGKVQEMVDGSALRNFLLTTGKYRMNEQNTVNVIVATYENLAEIKELDFVRSITSRKHNGLQFNVMKMDENLYINKVNTYMGRNTFEMYEKVEDAVKDVQEALNYDISTLVFEKLAAEKQEAAKLEERKSELLDKILFLKEKKEDLSKADQENQSIKEATALVNSELDKFQAEFNAIGEAKVVEAKYKPGTKTKDGGSINSFSDEEGTYLVSYDDGTTKEFKEGDIVVAENTNEAKYQPGTKTSDGGSINSYSDEEGTYLVSYDDGTTKEFKEGEIKVSEATNEDHIPPGTKVECSDGMIGTLQSWSSDDEEYIVMYNDGTTHPHKESEVKPVE